MNKKIVLSDSAQAVLDCLFGCVDVKELRDNYFIDNSILEVKEALEFCCNSDGDDGGIGDFLGGINYQKERQKKQSTVGKKKETGK